MTNNDWRLCRAGLYFLAFFTLWLGIWIGKFFGKIDFDQILYHFSFGSDGILESDTSLVTRFLKWCIVFPLLCTAAAIYLEQRFSRRRQETATNMAGKFRKLSHRFAPLFVLVPGFGFLLHITSAWGYVASNYGQDYFSSHYVSPAKVQIKRQSGVPQKNLVLIYVESLEASYSSRAVFHENLLQPLDAIEGTSFARFRQVPGTQWTIAGIVSSQCGLPLMRVSSYKMNDQGRLMKSFLPNAICLSDILAQHGYRNVFMGGASLNFAGKDKFLRDHQYHEAYGRDQWESLGYQSDQMNKWGLYDDDLFAQAKLKVKQLRAKKQPFNLTLLTVDTHEPEGFVSRRCRKQGVPDFKHIVRCSADTVAEFVNHMKQEGYLADTNVIILGDHLVRTNPVIDELDHMSERLIFNKFIGSNLPQKNRDDIVHFDLFPTILEFIGIEVPADRLGLGYGAFNRIEKKPEQGRMEEMQRTLLNPSAVYMNLWKA